MSRVPIRERPAVRADPHTDPLHLAHPAGRSVQREDRVEGKITHAPGAFGGSIHGGVHRDQRVIRRQLQIHFKHVYAERRRLAKRGHGISRKEVDPARVGNH